MFPHTTAAVGGALSAITSLPPPSALPPLLPEELLSALTVLSLAASVTPLPLPAPELLLDELTAPPLLLLFKPPPLPDPLPLPLPDPLPIPELLPEPPLLPDPLPLLVPAPLPLPLLLLKLPSPGPALLSDPQAAVTATPTETKKKSFAPLMAQKPFRKHPGRKYLTHARRARADRNEQRRQTTRS